METAKGLRKFSASRVALGLGLAFLGAMVAPWMLVFSGLFLWPPLLISVLFAWTGLLPAVVCAFLMLLSPVLYGAMMVGISGAPQYMWMVIEQGMPALFGSAAWMLGAGLMLVLPGIGTIFLLSRRMPFARAVGIGIAGQLALLLLGVVALRGLIGADLIEALVSWLKGAIEEMPGRVIGQLLQMMGRSGVFGTSTGINFDKWILTSAERAQLLDLIYLSIDRVLRLNLVSMMIQSGTTTGLLSYAMAARICVSRGDEPQIPYLPLHAWRLRMDVIIGLPVVALACAIANYAGVPGMDSGYAAMRGLCSLAFAVQGAAAVSRRLRQGGTSPKRRTLMISVLVVLGGPLLSVLGIWSAMLGSRGLLMMRKTKGD